MCKIIEKFKYPYIIRICIEKRDLMSKNRGIHTEDDISALNTFIQNIEERNNLSFAKIMALLKEKRKETSRLIVPSYIFKDRTFGILAAITKYMKENMDLKYSEIAKLLQRDNRIIWTTYNRYKKRKPFSIDKSSLNIPVSVFTNKKLGPLESLTKYLKEDLNLSFREISSLINRDNRTAWASYNNALKKLKK